MRPMKFRRQPVRQRLSSIALLLLTLPRLINPSTPYRIALESAGAIVLIIAIVLMFTARGNKNCTISQ